MRGNKTRMKCGNFEEDTLPDAEKQADEEDGQLHFLDEAGINLHDQIGTSYAPIGQTPVLDVPKIRIQQNLIASVTPEGDLTLDLFSGTLTAHKFIDFLEHLIASSDRKVFLVLDHHPVHTAGAVEKWVDNHPDEIQLVWLPRYSPEYNPDKKEGVTNRSTKKNLSARFLRERTKSPATNRELDRRTNETRRSRRRGRNRGAIPEKTLHPIPCRRSRNPSGPDQCK